MKKKPRLDGERVLDALNGDQEDRQKHRNGSTFNSERARRAAQRRWELREAKESIREAKTPEARLAALRDAAWDVLSRRGIEQELDKLAEDDPKRFWDVMQGLLPKSKAIEEATKPQDQIDREALGDAPEILAKWTEEAEKRWPKLDGQAGR